MEKHLIKHKSEHTPPGEVAFLFCLESSLEWRNGGREKTKQNWDAALAGLTTQKKNRPQRE